MNDIEKAIEQLKHDKENFEALLKEYRPSTIKERVESIIKSHILAIQALEKQLNGGWIPVGERLPNRETGCLVWQKIDGHYKYNIWHYVTDFPSSVIAWQPLPKPFKEVENED